MIETNQTNDSSGGAPEIMKNVPRGADPIPGILPLVASGFTGGSTEYTQETLTKLKESGFNVLLDDFTVAVNSMVMPGRPITVNDSTLKSAMDKAVSCGMRLIPGVSPSVPSNLNNKVSLEYMVRDYTPKRNCPGWYISRTAEESNFSDIVDTATKILDKDHWHKPVFFRMKPAASASDLKGSFSTASKKIEFSNYCENLKTQCPPSVWWNTQRAFPDSMEDTELNPIYLGTLHTAYEKAHSTNRAMWSSVNTKFPIPETPPRTSIAESNLNTIKIRMGMEARCALALGTKGLVFENFCDNMSQPITQNNTVGDIVKDINVNLGNVSSAFIGTVLMESGVHNGDSSLYEAIDPIGSSCGPLTSITGASAPILVSRFVNPLGSKEYIVLVNLSLTKSQSVTATFSNTVENMNPLKGVTGTLKPNPGFGGFLAIEYPSLDEASSGTSFSLKIQAGDWRVFSRQRPLSDFGL